MTFKQQTLLYVSIISSHFSHHDLHYDHFIRRSFALWSSPKDTALESALLGSRRWIVNNQIKNIILQYPNQSPPVNSIQKKFKSLDLQGKVLNWLKKYPCCFEVNFEDGEHICRLTKRMLSLVEDEETAQRNQEMILTEKLARLLLLSSNHRLNVVKLNGIKKSFGFPDDYLLLIVPKYPDMFRLVNHSGQRSLMEVEIITWDPKLMISKIEAHARDDNIQPSFICCLPFSLEKSWQRLLEFNQRSPYVSPYSSCATNAETTEKRASRVGPCAAFSNNLKEDLYYKAWAFQERILTTR